MDEFIAGWLPISVALLICVLTYLFTRSKISLLTKSNEYLRYSNNELKACVKDKNAEISTLRKTISSLEKIPPKQESRELLDFMTDLKINGYGIIRIDPDSVFYKGTR